MQDPVILILIFLVNRGGYYTYFDVENNLGGFFFFFCFEVFPNPNLEKFKAFVSGKV